MEKDINLNIKAQGPVGPMGPQGERGPVGPTGPKGDKGDTGPQGATGPKGNTGDRGPQGIQGPKGDKGDTGSNFYYSTYEASANQDTMFWTDLHPTANPPRLGEHIITPSGKVYEITKVHPDTNPKTYGIGEQLTDLHGIKGDKGDTGSQGPAGPIGPQGKQGIQGVAGPKGDPGSTGATGPTGTTGPQGSRGYSFWSMKMATGGNVSGRYITDLYNGSKTNMPMVGDTVLQPDGSVYQITGVSNTDDGSNGGGTFSLGASLFSIKGATGQNGNNGSDGKSAYEIAKENGFIGTEQDWLDSLGNQTVGIKNKVLDKYSNTYHINSPSEGFLNDVQGAFYRNGLWHLYFLFNSEARYNSNGDQVGKNGTEWYHVTTKDWINWKYEGVAIHKYKTEWGDVASGSIYIDEENDFGKGNNTVIVYATAYGGDKGQNVMGYYSTDNGYNFQPLQNEPILRHVGGADTNFRDPYLTKIKGKWVVYMAEGDKIGIYTSNSPMSGYSYIDGLFPPHPLLECPTLLQMNANGDSNEQKWVLFYGGNDGALSTGTYASVGHLDDRMVFVSEQDNIRVDNGPDFYGSKMFLDKNGGHNYVLGSAWEGNWGYSTKLPNEGRMGSISLTRKIKLLKNGNTYSLFSGMVGVFNYQVTSSDQDIPSGATLSNIGDGDSFKIAIHLKNMQQYNRNVVIKIVGNQYDCDFLMNFAGNTVKGHRYNASFVNDAEFGKDRTFNVALSGKNDIWVNFYVDRTSIEIEFPDGQTYTMVKFPAGRSNESITVTADQSIKFDYEYTQLDSNSVRSVTNNTHLSRWIIE